MKETKGKKKRKPSPVRDYGEPAKAKTGFLIEESAAGYSVPARGKPSGKTRDMSEQFGMNLADFADVLEVTTKTLSRWKQKGEILTPQQSDRVTILEQIFAHGDLVLGSREGMKRWIHEKVFALDGAKPVDMLKTESGRRMVDDVLYQMEYGIF